MISRYITGKHLIETLSTIVLFICLNNFAYAQEWPIYKVHVSSEENSIKGIRGWSKYNAIDDNIETIWSSTINNTSAQIAYWFNDNRLQQVNYIKLRPRYFENTSLCFPIDFQVNYSDGAKWNPIQTYSNFPVPKENNWIILPLGKTVTTDGIQLIASKLGKDNNGNSYLQLAEVKAGYDPLFEQLIFKGNNGKIYNEIHNVGSGSFDPNKISNWNYDHRRPLLSGHNIYAPSIVFNGAWNIYFGGWLNKNDVKDRVYIRTTYDTFNTFQEPVQQIFSMTYEHVNNESVIKVSDSEWRMLFTTYPNNATNKPGYATSINGANWTPMYASPSNLISMVGYKNWENADVNGSNVIYYENGKYHLFFDDFNKPTSVFYATGTTANTYTYEGVALNEFKIANDLKSFTLNGKQQYLMGLHFNTDKIWYSVSDSLTTFPSTNVLFSNLDSNDKYITSIGFVTAGNRLYGALYGAGVSSTLTTNRIFAAWLQKKVIFKSDKVRWGDIEHANGPDKIWLFMSAEIETGKFYIYDTDGITLLYTSPPVTIKKGDIWEYKAE